MKLGDFVCFEAVVPHLESTDRDGVITEMVTSLAKAGQLEGVDGQEIIDAVLLRENEASTGIGKGVAVPHVKHAGIKDVVAVVGCSDNGIDFSSLDKQLVYSVILLLSPADSPDKHLQAMENVFRTLQKEDFRRFLHQAQSVEAVRDAIMDQESD
jgi:mannitol/fructose-specific phosphotransferase system IIA component (Ntr-type)